MPEFKIATYNLGSNNSNQRMHWQWLFEVANPDILFLQEAFHPEAYMPPAFWQTYRSHFLWANLPGQSWGSGLFIKTGTIKPITDPKFSGWLVGAQVEGLPPALTGGRPLCIFNLHAQPPYEDAVHLALDWLTTLSNDSDFLIGGGFNLTAGFRHPTEHLQDSDLALLHRMRQRFNLMSAWQAANPNRNLPQTLRDNNDPTRRYHCDALFIPSVWYRYLDACAVLASPEWDKLSDHNPVVATLNLF